MSDGGLFIDPVNHLLKSGGFRPVDEDDLEVIRRALIGMEFRWNCVNIMTDSCWAVCDAIMTHRGIIFKQAYLGGDSGCRVVTEVVEP